MGSSGKSLGPAAQMSASFGVSRSEEHTSELQSQSNLVCRLLLEKKNHHVLGLLPAGQRLDRLQLDLHDFVALPLEHMLPDVHQRYPPAPRRQLHPAADLPIRLQR